MMLRRRMILSELSVPEWTFLQAPEHRPDARTRMHPCRLWVDTGMYMYAQVVKGLVKQCVCRSNMTVHVQHTHQISPEPTTVSLYCRVTPCPGRSSQPLVVAPCLSVHVCSRCAARRSIPAGSDAGWVGSSPPRRTSTHPRGRRAISSAAQFAAFDFVPVYSTHVPTAHWLVPVPFTVQLVHELGAWH
jgi:hypothetical protein